MHRKSGQRNVAATFAHLLQSSWSAALQELRSIGRKINICHRRDWRFLPGIVWWCMNLKGEEKNYIYLCFRRNVVCLCFRLNWWFICWSCVPFLKFCKKEKKIKQIIAKVNNIIESNIYVYLIETNTVLIIIHSMSNRRIFVYFCFYSIFLYTSWSFKLEKIYKINEFSNIWNFRKSVEKILE